MGSIQVSPADVRSEEGDYRDALACDMCKGPLDESEKKAGACIECILSADEVVFVMADSVGLPGEV